MFVISLLRNGQLIKTAVLQNANEAVDVAQSWYQKHKEEFGKDGYIAIDQSSGKQDATRFAEIRFDQSPDEANLFLALKSSGEQQRLFVSKFTALSKQFLIHLLEFGLVKLTEYLVEKNKSNKGTQ